MNRSMQLLCLGALALLPQAILAAPYVIEAEDILASADWTDKRAAGANLVIGNVYDNWASNDNGLKIVDTDATTDGQWIRTTTAAGTLHAGSGETAGTATAVFGLKTAGADAEGFGGTVYSRSVILSFAQDGARTRRGVALAFRPDKMAAITTTGAIIGGAELTGIDNTSYHIYTIVARDYGYAFDVYRDGVKIFNNIANNSAAESAIGGTAGLDALSVATSIGNARGDWTIDWVGYRAGEYPEWAPLPEPASALLLSVGLLVLRRRRA